MKSFTRLASVSLVALAPVILAACGGRTAAFEEEDETGVVADTGGSLADTGGGGGDGFFPDDTTIFPDDEGVWVDADPDDAWWDDTTIPPFDSGTPSKDTGTPKPDTGTPIKDSGVISTDTGVSSFDTGTPKPDTGSFDAGTLYSTCAKISAATCTPAFKSCCEANGFTYDSLGCDDISRNWCDDAVDGVVAGKTKYNPAFADACADGWRAMTTTCKPHLFDWVKSETACSQLFNGTLSPGATCTRATECRALPGETAWCDETAKRCRAYSVVGVGASCNYFGATIRWCDRGLTCDTFGGKCITATPIGGTCFGADDTACGIGNACKSGKCAVGSAPGASCIRDLECASWDCQFGKCTDIRVTIPSKALCGGI